MTNWRDHHSFAQCGMKIIKGVAKGRITEKISRKTCFYASEVTLINRKDYPFWRDSFDFIPIFEIQRVWQSSFYVGFFPRTYVDRNMDHEEDSIQQI